jgi:hypothetical protein
MGFREQKKLLEELRRFENKMTPKDLEAYKMFVKREKDEEDFDTVSMSRLRVLHQTYFASRPKPDISKYFKS